MKPSTSEKPSWGKPSGKPTWPEEDCETKTYDTTVTDVITKTITVSKGTDSWPELTTVTLTSTKKVTVTIPKPKETWATQTPYAPAPSAPGKPEAPAPSMPGKPEAPVVPYVPKPETSGKPEAPVVPYVPAAGYSKASYTPVAPVATGSYAKPSGYSKPSATTKGYQPVQATANAAVKNGAASAGMLAAVVLAFF